MAGAQRNRNEQHGTPPEPQRPGQKRRKRLVYAIISHTNMKKRAPILPYLLLNILVSAGTIVLVLFLWQKVFGGSLPVFSGLNRTRQPAQAAQHQLAGLRRSLLCGLGVLTVASGLGALATQPEALLALRALEVFEPQLHPCICPV